MRLYDTEKNVIIEGNDRLGEIQVRGKGIFNEYWGLPDQTRKEFQDDAWFKTGDTGMRTSETGGMYKVLGRSSVDILKVGLGLRNVALNQIN